MFILIAHVDRIIKTKKLFVNKVIKYLTRKVFFFLETNGFRGFTENSSFPQYFNRKY